MSIFIYRRSGGPRAHERITCKQAALNWLDRAAPYMSAVGFEPERLRRRPGKPKNTQMNARRFEIVQTQSYAECPADSAVDFLACKNTSNFTLVVLRSSVASLGPPVLGLPSRDVRLNTPVSGLACIPRSPLPDPARATAAVHPTVRPTMRSDLATGRGHTPRIPRSKCSSTENG